MALRTRTSTRERVLDASLALFNARGFVRSTTAEVSEAAGINEGNLYYWFPRKEQLAEALFERFEAAMIAVAESPVADPGVLSTYTDYQRRWFDLMWAFRFLYREGPALRAVAPALRGRLLALNGRSQAALLHVFEEMRAHGLLRATAGEIEVLISNIWIVSAYWMDFRTIESGADITEADFAWGFRQVEMLYRPYLTVEK